MDVSSPHYGCSCRPSFLNFARTGNPNGGGLPNWKPYTAEKGETMILNDQSMLALDPDREARKSLV